MSIPKIKRELFDPEQVDGAVQNDWYILPIIILIGIVATIGIVGADNFIEVMSDFIVGIRANI